MLYKVLSLKVIHQSYKRAKIYLRKVAKIYRRLFGGGQVFAPHQTNVGANKQWSAIVKEIWLSMHPRNFGSHVTVCPPARPPLRPFAPQAHQCSLRKHPFLLALRRRGRFLRAKRPHRRRARRNGCFRRLTPMQNNSISRYGNPKCNSRFFGGKSHGHPDF